MNPRALIVIAVFMFAFTIGDRVVNPCINTGKCQLLGTTCTAPSDINSCIVTRGGVNYTCSSPPSGFSYSGVTCTWTTGCTFCRANGRFNTAPDCIWNIV
jgi:hypothetical protein